MVSPAWPAPGGFAGQAVRAATSDAEATRAQIDLALIVFGVLPAVGFSETIERQRRQGELLSERGHGKTHSRGGPRGLY